MPGSFDGSSRLSCGVESGPLGAYACGVSRFIRPFPAFLRASLLVLLVLGIVVKPVLAQVGELHAAQHASLTDADGQGHGHEHGSDQGDESNSDHTQGAHGLMHQGSAGGTSVEVPLPLTLPALTGEGAALPPTGDAVLPPAHFGTPFRPPIV